jgi:hypothetical protein
MHKTNKSTKTLEEGNMRNLVICVIILLALALNCEATAPVLLTGSNGLAILSQLEGSAKTANLSTNTGLWNWGSIPEGYTLNRSGILNPLDGTALSNDYGDWAPSI